MTTVTSEDPVAVERLLAPEWKDWFAEIRIGPSGSDWHAGGSGEAEATGTQALTIRLESKPASTIVTMRPVGGLIRRRSVSSWGGSDWFAGNAGQAGRTPIRRPLLRRCWRGGRTASPVITIVMLTGVMAAAVAQSYPR